MKAHEFCYWLQGFFEISESKSGISEKQEQIIKRHLSLVFSHELDKQNDGGDKELAKKLQTIHDGPVGDAVYRC